MTIPAHLVVRTVGEHVDQQRQYRQYEGHEEGHPYLVHLSVGTKNYVTSQILLVLLDHSHLEDVDGEREEEHHV